jgi:FAD/FMN-containing dehydrogenase
MTTVELDYALDMRMKMARADVVTPLTGREVALAVRNAADEVAELRLDLSRMKRVVIDPRARTARVQPGVSTREIEQVRDELQRLTNRSSHAPNCLVLAVG